MKQVSSGWSVKAEGAEGVTDPSVHTRGLNCPVCS